LQQRNKKSINRVSDSNLSNKFLQAEKRIYGNFSESHQIALDESMMLWLAWRGDPEYMITASGINFDKEISWRLIHYKDISSMFEKYDHVESRILGGIIPDHMLAYFARFLINETEKVPGYQVHIEESIANDKERTNYYSIEPNDSFKYLSSGKTIVARWPSESSSVLCTRTITISNKEVRCSKYPSIDSQYKQTINTNKFMKFIETRARQRKHRSLSRWLLTG
jgi:uncharacterized membrane protein YecN with MAPEG domain